jgi:hypothetical protein
MGKKYIHKFWRPWEDIGRKSVDSATENKYIVKSVNSNLGVNLDGPTQKKVVFLIIIISLN